MKNHYFENIDHLNIYVENLADSISWYKKIFGFEQVENGTDENGPWAILKHNQSMLCLYENKDFSKLKDDRFNHIGFRINNREAFETILKQEKVKVLYGGAYRYPKSWSWYLVDPSGYEVEVSLWDNNTITF